MEHHVEHIESAAGKPHHQGLPGFADLLASDHDRFGMVFNRFDRLAMENLLYLQSELHELEGRFEDLHSRDLKTSTLRHLNGIQQKDSPLFDMD
jgi:hypothetical protein